MKDINFGSIDRRQLHVRFFTPHEFQAGWTFQPRLMLDWRAWWSTIFRRDHWSFSWRRFVGSNHRCYCPIGSMLNGHLKIAGFQVQWFYSNYPGKSPCWCDRAIEELNNPKPGELDEAYHTGDGA